MADIASNKRAHWTLDETSGTSAADSSGNGYTGTYARNASNTTVASAGGGLGTACSANGTNDRIATSAVIPPGPITISFWAKFSSADVSGMTVLRDNTTLQVYRASTTLYWDFGGFSPGVNRISTSIAAVDDKWTHYVLTSTGTSGSPRMEMFFDGVSAASGSYASQPASSSSLFSICSHTDGSSKAKCEIDDVRIYTRVLAADDIAALYNLGKPQNTVAPGITGDCIVGQTLSGTSGTWSDGSVNARKWQSATDGSGTGAADIGGATAADFTITESELEKYVRYGVQYSNSIGTTWAYSSWMGPIEAPPSLYRPRCPSFSLSLPTLSLG